MCHNLQGHGWVDGWMGSGCTASLLPEHSVFLLVLTQLCGSHSFQTGPWAFLALLKDLSHAGIQNFTCNHSDLTLVISETPVRGGNKVSYVSP